MYKTAAAVAAGPAEWLIGSIPPRYADLEFKNRERERGFRRHIVIERPRITNAPRVTSS